VSHLSSIGLVTVASTCTLTNVVFIHAPIHPCFPSLLLGARGLLSSDTSDDYAVMLLAEMSVVETVPRDITRYKVTHSTVFLDIHIVQVRVYYYVCRQEGERTQSAANGDGRRLQRPAVSSSFAFVAKSSSLEPVPGPRPRHAVRDLLAAIDDVTAASIIRRLGGRRGTPPVTSIAAAHVNGFVATTVACSSADCDGRGVGGRCRRSTGLRQLLLLSGYALRLFVGRRRRAAAESQPGNSSGDCCGRRQ